jgi:NADP-dependent 3-hydroxy acid dehydrogenase YdfG
MGAGVTPVRGRVVALTGAGSGIGRALSVELSGAGAHLALADVDATGLAETAARCADGRPVSTHVVDVADAAAVHDFAQQALARHGVVDVLVNNAGVNAAATVERLTLDDYAWVLGVDLWGVIHGVKAFLPVLLTRPQAHVVTVGSVNSFMPFPCDSAYTAAKFAADGFTRSLAQELAGSTVRVSMVYPGGVATNASRNSRYTTQAQDEAFASRALTSPQRAASVIVRGIAHNRASIYVGADARALAVASRVAPHATQRLITWGWRRLERPQRSQAG